MQLVCLLEHMKGQSVLVNGSQYAVDDKGHAFVSNTEDAKALLANAGGWMTKPEPLMPEGADGQPEYLHIPEDIYAEPPGTAEVVSPDAAALARLALESPVATNVPDPVERAEELREERVRESMPEAQETGFGAPVTADDIIQPTAQPKPTAVSAPQSPLNARLGKTHLSKKGSRK